MKEELIHLSHQERKAVSSFVRKIREELGDDILDIRLFGSKARGGCQEDSDIDIFILIREKGAARGILALEETERSMQKMKYKV